ncbi:hypothetical protein KY363_02425 [Candidatus Woesearchaeota archaeon]|nr:hypothetical protein [Candidatus Woesearchaeota archaeon]
MNEDHHGQSCPYCGKDTDRKQWRSVFSTCNSHYKECTCACGHKVTVRVPFIGSGHDSWNSRFRNLDKRIEEEEEE